MKATAAPAIEHSSASQASHEDKKGSTSFFGSTAERKSPFFTPRIQTKLIIDQPGDRYEQQADRIADNLVKHSGGQKPDNQFVPKSKEHFMIRRKVAARLVSCDKKIHKAPKDVVSVLTKLDSRAQGLVGKAIVALGQYANAVYNGRRDRTNRVDWAFSRRFGKPALSRKGYINRLSGNKNTDFNMVLSGELRLLGQRYKLMTKLLNSYLKYKCKGSMELVRSKSLPGGKGYNPASILGSSILLFQPFWTTYNHPDEQVHILIHEYAHLTRPFDNHGFHFGTYSRFRHQTCYAEFISDLFNLKPTVQGDPCEPYSIQVQ